MIKSNDQSNDQSNDLMINQKKNKLK